MTPQEALNLFDYDRWATDKQLDVVTMLSDEQYLKDLGSSYGGLRGTLVHIYSAEFIWHSRWRGVSPTGFATEAELPTLDRLRGRWAELRGEIIEFVTGLNDEKLRQPLAYKDTKGNPYSQPLSHQIQHVINHSTYHRGQVTTMLRQLGVTPPGSIDLIVYYREVQANLESTRHWIEKV